MVDFWLLDEIVKMGWVFSICGLPDRTFLVVLSVPDHGAETAVLDSQREAFQWLEGEIMQNHGGSTLCTRLRGGASGTA